MHRVLAINPGSTSTKVAVYEDESPLLLQTLRHQADELAYLMNRALPSIRSAP
jgi:butyrate kinase